MVWRARKCELKRVAVCIHNTVTKVVAMYTERMNYADTQDSNMDMVPYGTVYSKSYAVSGTDYTAGG